jgi:hypothetical protein
MRLREDHCSVEERTGIVGTEGRGRCCIQEAAVCFFIFVLDIDGMLPVLPEDGEIGIGLRT